ncbi:hypothetical protein OAO18_02510 [Francisellaceae bacterium]|nr:hypothetical protein [Francisellaceae bacterium]
MKSNHLGLNIFIFVYIALWASTPLISLYPNGIILYGCIYFLLLFVILFDSTKNTFSFLLAFSTFLYFYQFPLINTFSNDTPAHQYNIILLPNQLIQMAIVYNTILLLLYICIKFIEKNISPEKVKEAITNYHLVDLLFFISSILSLILVFYSIARAGGVNAYFALDKFQALEVSKFIYFNYNHFSILAFLLGALSKNRIIRLLAWGLITFIILFNVLSAMRYMLLFGGVIAFSVMVKRVKFWHILLAFSGAILGGLTKLVYYNLKLFFLGKIPADKIIWFDFDTFYQTVILFQDGQGNLLLFAQYIGRFTSYDYFKLMSGIFVNSVPFSSIVWGENSSAGDLMQEHLGIAWGGLASAPYIIPYMCFGLFGIVLIYYAYYLTLYTFSRVINSETMITSLLFFSSIPFTLIYFQRNELSAIYKNFFIEFAAIIIIVFIAKSMQLLLSKKAINDL